VEVESRSDIDTEAVLVAVKSKSKGVLLVIINRKTRRIN